MAAKGSCTPWDNVCDRKFPVGAVGVEGGKCTANAYSCHRHCHQPGALSPSKRATAHKPAATLPCENNFIKSLFVCSWGKGGASRRGGQVL